MRLVRSEYSDSEIFCGYDGEIAEAQILSAISYHYGLCDVSDFEGIHRSEMDATHTNTEADLDSFSELSQEYDNVEFIQLRPVH